MGLLILQGLLHAPVGELVAVDVVQDRLDLAQRLGVPEIYNAAQIDKTELAQALKKREFDVVVDASATRRVWTWRRTSSSAAG